MDTVPTLEYLCLVKEESSRTIAISFVRHNQASVSPVSVGASDNATVGAY